MTAVLAVDISLCSRKFFLSPRFLIYEGLLLSKLILWHIQWAYVGTGE
jgi:hypothetical protein